MAIVSPLIMCMSLSVCSTPIITPNAAQENDIPKDVIESKIIVPAMTQSSLSIADQKPIKDIISFQYNLNLQRPILSKPEPLPAFTTEIEFTPSSWPLRGTFNPLGMKLKLHMPL